MLRGAGYPGPILAITTGDVNGYAAQHGVEPGRVGDYISATLNKPFIRDELIRAVTTLLPQLQEALPTGFFLSRLFWF